MVTTVLGIDILGIEVPDDRPVFLAALAVHVAAGLTAGGTGCCGMARRCPARTWRC